MKVHPQLLSRVKNPQLLATPKCFRDASRTFPVYDPSGSITTDAPLAEVPDFDSCAAVIEESRKAFPSFASLLANERSKMLRAYAQAQRKNMDDLATILSSENGKPIREARGEIEYGAGYLDWFAEEAKRVYGTTIPAPFPNRQTIVTREPVGTVSVICPFNFPSAMLMRKVAAALSVGCTIVMRPSEDVPLSAIALQNLAEQVFPSGVMNLVPTSRENAGKVGQELCTDPRVAKISFTGSTAVGKELMRHAAGSVKRVSMELGGNAPFIVFPCADLKQAVDGLMISKFRNAGQTCISASRIYVHGSVLKEFLALLQERMNKLKIGKALDTETDIGSLIHSRAVQRVHTLVSESIKQGATLVTGGQILAEQHGPNYYAPTILTDVKDEHQVFQHEIFGPVAAISSFEEESEVISRANQSLAGLAAYVFATDASRLQRVCRALETGMIGVNTGAISTETAPFGGVKQSGFGREGSLYGVEDYTNIKYVSWHISNSS